ncbi:MAG: nuclear transport factor 2 family protein [Pseudomonadota bacterium]
MDHYTVTDIVAEGDRIIVLSDTKFAFKATGKSVETEKADVWRVRDGQLVEFFELFDTASMRAAALPD